MIFNIFAINHRIKKRISTDLIIIMGRLGKVFSYMKKSRMFGLSYMFHIKYIIKIFLSLEKVRCLYHLRMFLWGLKFIIKNHKFPLRFLEKKLSTKHPFKKIYVHMNYIIMKFLYFSLYIWVDLVIEI